MIQTQSVAVEMYSEDLHINVTVRRFSVKWSLLNTQYSRWVKQHCKIAEMFKRDIISRDIVPEFIVWRWYLTVQFRALHSPALAPLKNGGDIQYGFLQKRLVPPFTVHLSQRAVQRIGVEKLSSTVKRDIQDVQGKRTIALSSAGTVNRGVDRTCSICVRLMHEFVQKISFIEQ